MLIYLVAVMRLENLDLDAAPLCFITAFLFWSFDLIDRIYARQSRLGSQNSMRELSSFNLLLLLIMHIAFSLKTAHSNLGSGIDMIYGKDASFNIHM